MNIGSFSIRLNVPTSTSKQKEIAIRFTGRDGLVLQLNNNQHPGILEVFFDSSWISAFPEEDERIYFGGRHKTQLQSIIVMQTKKNYHQIINAFFKFDSMLSAGYMKYVDVKDVDVDIITAVIEYIVGGSSSKYRDKLDDYIKQNFYLFTQNTTQITLNLKKINDIKNRSFIDILMHSIQAQKRASNNNNNLFKPIIFKLFTNLSEIIIYSSGDKLYAFNILSLLSILSDNSLPKSFKTITIKDYSNMSDGWLNKVFCDELEEAFNSKQLKMELKKNLYSNDHPKHQDWMIITV